METKKNLYEKLLDIQTRLSAPKNQYNSFSNFYYRNCEDILEAVKPLLKENKVTLKISDEMLEIGGKNYFKSTATLIDLESATSIENTAYARESEARKGMSEEQLSGSCSSYCRKYCLNGLFLIDDNKDPDTEPGDGKPKATKPKTDNDKATPVQVQMLKKVYTGDALKKLLDTNKISKIEDLPMTKASEYVAAIKEKIEKSKEANNDKQ
jgi:hypothetical protein